jgi:hypothetical protein
MLKSSSLCLCSSNLSTFWLKIEQFYPRWPPLLKIEISSKGQNCSILSQKVPKFELYNFGPLKKFLFLVMAAILDKEQR